MLTYSTCETRSVVILALLVPQAYSTSGSSQILIHLPSQDKLGLRTLGRTCLLSLNSLRGRFLIRDAHGSAGVPPPSFLTVHDVRALSCKVSISRAGL
jgi:hypothetical protein